MCTGKAHSYRALDLVHRRRSVRLHLENHAPFEWVTGDQTVNDKTTLGFHPVAKLVSSAY
jgi:hypothetical protein